MKTFTGCIKDGEKIILEDVALTLKSKSGTNIRTEWWGSFVIPKGEDDAWAIIESSDSLSLVLSDGRTGRIHCVPGGMGSGSLATFRGNGALA